MARSLTAGATLLLLVVVLSHTSLASPATRKSLRSIDCRRLVFHPRCRGVAAKRAMPSLMEGGEDRYTADSGRDAPPYSMDPLLASLLDRLADGGPHRGGVLEAERAEDTRESDGDPAWTSVSEQGSPKAADFGRFDWQVARKRIKEQEVTYDY